MDKDSYYKNADRLYEKYKKLEIRKNDKLAAQFNIVSAGLFNYLPDIKTERHEILFKEILFHQKLSLLEQGRKDILDNTEIKNLEPGTWNQLKRDPAIICTFHLGSYRLINLLLAEQGVSFSLVIAKSVLESQGASFTELFNQVSGRGNASFNVIDAEAPSAAIQMLRDLKKGNSLVIYIDGNTGSISNGVQKESYITVPFLNQQISVRRGVGFLAHASNRPVLPVICYRNSLKSIVLHFFKAIAPNENQSRDAFAYELITNLYGSFEPFIRRYPEQWEGWIYLHKSAKIINPQQSQHNINMLDPSDKLIFNKEQFGLFKTKGHYYLFNKASYMSYSVNMVVYNLLENAMDCPINRSSIDLNLLSELFKHNALIIA
ncbi:lysophospholipid acyltransferase family protein [Niabella hirudinis]|uniref:lysophospholipid acyltransferase family protein n=1 Tax=Niabella hirudinis TaxID=1285929 RepID=UPI003EBC6399